MNQPVGGNKGLKRKETFEAKKEKSVAKRNRTTASSSSSTLICKSCDTSGHSSARSELFPNHNYTLQELIEKDIGAKNQRYTISLPLKGFLNKADDDILFTGYYPQHWYRLHLKKISLVWRIVFSAKIERIYGTFPKNSISDCILG
ncbi:hypothetical protein INT47_005918 [Mucor saturninus]|uniref:Uncharacterized protein n=1 Tax=Mucor saturninus TaxID=64648 RepID=A0A8H7R967_9FUNG|nr:hypothetical protein INT47_005918 [Mucor saturninus]